MEEMGRARYVRKCTKLPRLSFGCSPQIAQPEVPKISFLSLYGCDYWWNLWPLVINSASFAPLPSPEVRGNWKFQLFLFFPTLLEGYLCHLISVLWGISKNLINTNWGVVRGSMTNKGYLLALHHREFLRLGARIQKWDQDQTPFYI